LHDIQIFTLVRTTIPLNPFKAFSRWVSFSKQVHYSIAWASLLSWGAQTSARSCFSPVCGVYKAWLWFGGSLASADQL